MMKGNFLSAKWEYLAMFNYEVDPQVLQKHLPPYTEIDYFNGKALVSVVGFLFNQTKVLGLRWPGYINFEEVNLRYYIKHFTGKEWKRGVGFVSEIVPKPLIAGLANFCYNEHYSVAKMSHTIAQQEEIISVDYAWQRKNEENNLMRVKALTALQDIEPASEAEFILEHYWGYNQLNKNTTIEYGVTHPRWKIYPVTEHSLQCDIEKLYGKEFVPFIQNKEPHSVFLAKGSEVTVSMPSKIRKSSKISF